MARNRNNKVNIDVEIDVNGTSELKKLDQELKKASGGVKNLDKSLVDADKEFKKSEGDLSSLTSKGLMPANSEFGKMALRVAGVSAPFLALGGAVVGYGVAMGVATKISLDWAMATSEQSKEIEKLSRLAGLSTTEFQKWSFASKSVGVEQDKMSDILKDVNDKVGDFLQNNAGPMKDFFDNIGPSVGVTAENFKNLSGAESLQLYVKSLDKANLSQAEMTFYMEAIGNDATALLPLLRNNSAEFERLSKISALTIMDENTIALAKEFSNDMAIIDGIFSSLKNVTAGPLFEQLNPAIDHMAKVLSDPEVLSGLQNGLGEIARLLGHLASDSITFATWVGKGVVDLLTTSNTEKLIELDEKRLDLFKEQGDLLQKLNELREDAGGIEGKNAGKINLTLSALSKVENQIKQIDQLSEKTDNAIKGIVEGVQKQPSAVGSRGGKTQADRDAILKAQKEQLAIEKERADAQRQFEKQLQDEINFHLKILSLTRDIEDAQLNLQAIKISTDANAGADSLDTAKGGFKPLTAIDTQFIEDEARAISEMESIRLEEIQNFELSRLEIINATEEEITLVKEKHALEREALELKSAELKASANERSKKEIQDQDKKILKAQEFAITSSLSSMTDIFAFATEQNKKFALAYQVTASAEALVSTYLATQRAFEMAGGYPLGIVPAGLTLAQGLTNVAKINQQHFADGGIVGGSFTGSSIGGDNTTASVRTGEMVLNSSQQRQLFDVANGKGGGGLTLNYAPVVSGGMTSDAIAKALRDDRTELIRVIQDTLQESNTIGAF